MAKKIVIEFISPDSYFEQDGMNAEDHPKRYHDHCHHRHHHHHHHRCHHRHPPNAHCPRQWEERATSKEGIKKIARKVWRQVTPAYLETLYESMPRRMQAVVEAQGGHTKY